MIYIPIWLDLLFIFSFYKVFVQCIYIPIWLDLLYTPPYIFCISSADLHSNMVRFIIITHSFFTLITSPFTFQYGQIYYYIAFYYSSPPFRIYIPIWLDLLLVFIFQFCFFVCYLHSNMVRFIINLNTVFQNVTVEFTFQYGQIYYSCRCAACCVRY